LKTKKIGFLFSLLAFFYICTTTKLVIAETLLEQVTQNNYNIPETDLPETGIVIEAENGQIFWEQDATKNIDAAELSNLMTIYLTLEAIQKGELSLDKKVIATQNDEAIGQIQSLNNNNIIAGIEYTVRDLLKLAVVPSSNVATLMLANLLEEQDGRFVTQMNNKAAELGMTQTTFNTATGIPAVQFNGYYQPEGYDFDAGNLTTATDLAILVYHLIREFSSILDITKELSFTVLPDSLYEETFETDNDSLYSRPFAFKGTDGLKTSQSTTGFNAITTAKQNGLRVITVITGVGNVLRPESKQAVFPISNTLTEQVFDNYEYKEIISAGQQELNKQTIQVENDWYAVVKKGEQPTFSLKDNQLTLTKSLPIISDSVSPLTASYREVTSPIEKNIEQHTFLAKIVNVVEITKLTILALGIALLGLIFLLMSFFIPIVPDEKRKNTHQKRSRISFLPTKKIIRWVGIGFCFIGFSILCIQYIL
jgi:D-alanyl-D-alanine carboxypeptidase